MDFILEISHLSFIFSLENKKFETADCSVKLQIQLTDSNTQCFTYFATQTLINHFQTPTL